MIKKERKISNKYGIIDTKEVKEEFHTRGYIATDHVDSVGDCIPLETLQTWQEQLNSTDSLDANPTSIHHDREDTTLIGLGANAKIEKLDDGHHGLWVDTHHNKTHSDFEDTKYQIDNKFISHYSIEYNTNEGATTHKENIDGSWVRVIEPSTELLGYGLASPRTVVNSEAKIVETDYKELINIKKNISEVTQMKEEVKEEPKETPEEKKDVPEEPKEEAPKEEPKETPAEDKEKKPEKVDHKEISKEVKEEIKKNILAELKETKPENAPLVNKGGKMEVKEKKLEKKELEFKEKMTEFKEGVLEGKSSHSEQWKIASKTEVLLKESGFKIEKGYPGMENKFEIKENKISLKENRVEQKAAVTTDLDYMGAQTTFLTALANYEQSPARYNDIYGPVIVNHLNDATTTWNLLTKVDMSQMSAIRFRARVSANSTADTYAYGSTPGFDGSAGIKKFNLPFVTSYVEVAAEFEAMEFGMGAGGIDVYATEIAYATKDLMTYLNQSQIFGSGDGTSEAESLGLDTTGCIKTTGDLYGHDVATLTTLKGAGLDNMSSAAITLKKMRAMIRTCITNGADRGDLFFVTSYLQHDFIKALIQDMQRIVPTSAKVGFTGVMELDGVPVFPDKDLDAASMTDDLFLLDRVFTKIAIKKAPTYVEFGLTSLVRKGIIWMMWNLYAEAPLHNYQIYGLATS